MYETSIIFLIISLTFINNSRNGGFMQTKKQQLIFRGVGRDGKYFFTSDLGSCIMNSRETPVPMNRKSRRAMPKIIRELTR